MSSQWYDFLSCKNRYIGGEITSYEGEYRYRGIIANITFERSYLRIYTDNAEYYFMGNWEEADDELIIGCSIDDASAPILDQEGNTRISIPFIGEAVLKPAEQFRSNFSDKVVVMESGVKDDDGHIFSVEAAECYAEEINGIVEYLANGQVRVWLGIDLTT